MEILIAKTCGLCNGCKRAIQKTIDSLDAGNKTTIFKEIVHNKNVNNLLLALGSRTENNIENISSDETVIIRAHGEPPVTYEFFDSKGISYIDCTCPNVTNIHKAVKSYYTQGYEIVLLGKCKDKLHPEVEGTMGWAEGKCHLVQDIEDLSKIKTLLGKKIYVVCQTTFNMALADKLIEEIQQIAQENACEIVINKSICTAQREINLSSLELAKKVDVMIVVGGKNSSNSKELYNNVLTQCKAVFIEDIYEYKQALQNANIDIKTINKIGLTAGASTMQDELVALKKLIEKSCVNKTEK